LLVIQRRYRRDGSALQWNLADVDDCHTEVTPLMSAGNFLAKRSVRVSTPRQECEGVLAGGTGERVLSVQLGDVRRLKEEHEVDM